MPTYQRLPRFVRDYQQLTGDQRAAFRRSVAQFVEDLKARRFRKGLRVKGVEGAPGVFELTWAADGRATFSFGEEVNAGQAHVIWRRVR